jgi:hypothetical protein
MNAAASAVPANSRKFGLTLIVDAMRYDTMASPAARRYMFPNLAALVEQGFVRRVVTNAQSTQFVMPAIFSQTYPLDYGGYNNGILNRPKSYIEALSEAGYRTHLFSSCNQLGIALGYERGFDTIRTTTDYRVILEQRLTRSIQYHLERIRSGEQSKEQALAVIRDDFGNLLNGIARDVDTQDHSIWSPTLRRINHRVGNAARRELELLKAHPEAVLDKLLRIAPGVYHKFLGRPHVSAAALFLGRFGASINWRTRRWISRRRWPPVLMLSHRPSIAREVIRPAIEFLTESAASEQPIHVHMHMMDVHDCRAINRPIHFLGRLRYLPRWAVARLRGWTRRHWIYDTALMSVDRELGRLFAALEKTGLMQRMMIVVTGDHGSDFAQSPRPKRQVGLRTYRVDLEVPLIVFDGGKTRSPGPAQLFDSMSISATLLDALGVRPSQSFKGCSGYSGGRKAVISESCGHGNADVSRRDLYFTVTTETHKLMAILVGSDMQVLKFFDLAEDSEELHDISKDPAHHDAIRRTFAHLERERREILEMRGVPIPLASWSLADEPAFY